MTKVERRRFVPCTPAGTPLVHLEGTTEDEAWKNLMVEAAHMPYKIKKNFVKRGYTVEEWTE